MKSNESLTRKLSIGIFYLMSSSLTSIGLNVILVAFVARKLGVENFGLYSAILSFVGLFQFISDFGLNRTLLKFGSTDMTKAQISFGNSLFLKSILMLPTLVIVLFFAFLAGYRNSELLILLTFTISMLLESYGMVFSSIRRILGDFKLISFFRVLRTIFNLAIVVYALTIANSVLSLAIANLILNIVIFTVSLINTLSLLKPKLRIRLIKDFFKDSSIFSLSDFFLNLYGRISTVLLSFTSDFHAVGIFSAALKFTKIATLLPNQVRFALLPTLYKILGTKISETDLESDLRKSKKVFNLLLKYMVLLAVPFVLLIYFFSDQIIQMVFGHKYDQAVPLVKLFSIFIFLRFIETPFTLFYTALHKHKTMVIFQGITSLTNAILSFILIPKYFAYGACIANIFSETLLALMLVVYGRTYSIWKLRTIVQSLLIPILLGIISFCLVVLLGTKINLWFQLFIAIGIYLSILFLIKYFDKTDKEFFRKMFTIKKS